MPGKSSGSFTELNPDMPDFYEFSAIARASYGVVVYTALGCFSR
jgi:hypothetical protein